MGLEPGAIRSVGEHKRLVQGVAAEVLFVHKKKEWVVKRPDS